MWDLEIIERRAPRAFTPRGKGLLADQSIHSQKETIDSGEIKGVKPTIIAYHEVNPLDVVG